MYVVKSGRWSEKYARHVYPAFTDRDTHDDIAAGLNNRWKAERYFSESELNAAVMAERERCAKVAEGHEQNREWVPGSLYESIRREVATRIRAVKESLTDAKAEA